MRAAALKYYSVQTTLMYRNNKKWVKNKIRKDMTIIFQQEPTAGTEQLQSHSIVIQKGK